MPTRFTHKNYYIDVHIIRRASSESELFNPKVDVGPEGGNHVVNIETSQAFENDKDAQACGFELGKEWIDKN